LDKAVFEEAFLDLDVVLSGEVFLDDMFLNEMFLSDIFLSDIFLSDMARTPLVLPPARTASPIERLLWLKVSGAVS
jgi:hypothetical protein